jgi:hypothetical protein
MWGCLGPEEVAGYGECAVILREHSPHHFWCGHLRIHRRNLARPSSIGLHGDQISAPDSSHLRRERGRQWNARADPRVGLSFKQTSLAILMSFAIAASILAGFAPITLFVWFNAPALASPDAILGHSLMLLTHVFVIAFAGVAANQRLLRLLETTSGHVRTGRAVFFSWLAGNLFLGAQLAWNLRPFIGSPKLAVQFLRNDPLRGNFYEAVWHALGHLFH